MDKECSENNEVNMRRELRESRVIAEAERVLNKFKPDKLAVLELLPELKTILTWGP